MAADINVFKVIMVKHFLLFVLLLGLLGLLFLPQTAEAVNIIDPSICAENPNRDPAICSVETPDDNALVGPDGLITRVSQWLVYISGALAVVLIIIAGFMFIFSQGNPQSAGRARSTVLYAIIGLVVVVIGQAIVTFVLNRLG